MVSEVLARVAIIINGKTAASIRRLHVCVRRPQSLSVLFNLKKHIKVRPVFRVSK